MGRCEGYYKLENHRCDRTAEREVRAVDGETYGVCAYHGRHVWTATVARWHGESDHRVSVPAELRTIPAPRTLAWS
jgi:hypothetical protein